MIWRGGLLSLMLLAGSPAAAQSTMIDVMDDDPVMNAAMAEAISHLDIILETVVDETGKTHPALNLKVAAPAIAGLRHVEIIWVENIDRRGDSFAGTLANG